MTAHPDTLGLMDRAKRLIDESNPPDQSPLTTAARDIREARAVVAELISKARAVTATGDERTLRIAINELRATLSTLTGAAQ